MSLLLKSTIDDLESPVAADAHVVSHFSSVIADALLGHTATSASPVVLNYPLYHDAISNLVLFCSNQYSDSPAPFMVGASAPQWLHLLQASQLLKVRPLADICCVRLADALRGKSAEDMREELGIVDDFTEDQKRVADRSYDWVHYG